jgi:hypothetical protein
MPTVEISKRTPYTHTEYARKYTKLTFGEPPTESEPAIHFVRGQEF